MECINNAVYETCKEGVIYYSTQDTLLLMVISVFLTILLPIVYKFVLEMIKGR